MAKKASFNKALPEQFAATGKSPLCLDGSRCGHFTNITMISNHIDLDHFLYLVSLLHGILVY
jgi:hypothetical protein